MDGNYWDVKWRARLGAWGVGLGLEAWGLGWAVGRGPGRHEGGRYAGFRLRATGFLNSPNLEPRAMIPRKP
jgi:hypothetical protein